MYPIDRSRWKSLAVIFFVKRVPNRKFCNIRRLKSVDQRFLCWTETSIDESEDLTTCNVRSGYSSAHRYAFAICLLVVWAGMGKVSMELRENLTETSFRLCMLQILSGALSPLLINQSSLSNSEAYFPCTQVERYTGLLEINLSEQASRITARPSSSFSILHRQPGIHKFNSDFSQLQQVIGRKKKTFFKLRLKIPLPVSFSSLL